MSTTSKGAPYPEESDPNDAADWLQQLAAWGDLHPGISSYTTAQRDVLVGADIWPGRVIFNLSNGQLEQNKVGTAGAASWSPVAPIRAMGSATLESSPSGETVTGWKSAVPYADLSQVSLTAPDVIGTDDDLTLTVRVDGWYQVSVESTQSMPTDEFFGVGWKASGAGVDAANPVIEAGYGVGKPRFIRTETILKMVAGKTIEPWIYTSAPNRRWGLRTTVIRVDQ
jgi:hypothetical protein